MLGTLVYVVPGFFAGLVQGITGFGSGIVLMTFLPFVLPIPQGAGVSTLTMSGPNAALVWRYRRGIHWLHIIIPFIVYSVVATVAVHVGQNLSAPLLKGLLGGLLVAIATYQVLMQYRGHTPSHIIWPVAVVFMVVSGFFNGLFGIGGPLMALYFLTESRSTTEYMASIQTFFMLDTVYVTTLRFSQGILQFHHLGFVAVGMIGAVLGTVVANRVIDRLNLDRVRRIVYIFIGISGLYYLVQSVI